ncbi:MAG TPA: HAD-IA family hydrolase [Methylocella sp.]|nr:HAD-IA family hydrolase [Methylocella sp.]
MLQFGKSGVDQMNIDVISTDIFDTILLRNSSCGRRHFLELSQRMARKLKSAGYCLNAEDILWARNEAQALAYRAIEIERPEGDVRLEHILRLQARLLGLPSSASEVLHEAEFECEVHALKPNWPLLDRLALFRKQGKRIIGISDTYLPETMLVRLLGKVANGHSIETIYSSSDWGVTKKSSRLFEKVIAAERMVAQRILHCGDNRLADYLMARKAGLQALLIERPRYVRDWRKLDALLFLIKHPAHSW